MSEFKAGDKVRVSADCNTSFAGRIGTVAYVDQRQAHVPVYFDDDPDATWYFLEGEIGRVPPTPKPYKKGDKVRVRPEILAGTHPSWPAGPLEVTRDQQPEDFYVHVRAFDDIFVNGQDYAMYVTDIERVLGDEHATASEPEPERSFHVGDWVRLKPGSPWENEYWTKYPGEIIDRHDGDPEFYKVRFCDGDDGWHTANALTRIAAFEDILDELDEPEPPETGWYAVDAPQSDHSFVTIALEPVDDDDVLARLWFRFYDHNGSDFAPFAEWPIELSGTDCFLLGDMLWKVE